jgi:hypothetical protein
MTMPELIRESTPVARKHYPCEASHWINQANWGASDFEPDEQLLLSAAEADRFKIRPGTRYLYQVQRVDGRLEVFRARIDMHNLCLKYELYPEE